jgi:glucose uptake protein GlcU
MEIAASLLESFMHAQKKSATERLQKFGVTYCSLSSFVNSKVLFLELVYRRKIYLFSFISGLLLSITFLTFHEIESLGICKAKFVDIFKTLPLYFLAVVTEAH